MQKKVQKVVNLTLHKNTRDKRRARERRKHLIGTAKRQAHDTEGLDGYCLITWDKEFDADASWLCGEIPTSNLPDFIRGTLQRAIGRQDNE